MATELYRYLMSYATENSSETIQGCTCEGGCSHPSGKCPSGNARCHSGGNCCFNEIYYPENRINARLKYNCKKLVNQYVFRSLDRYASEIFYALNEYSSVINNYEKYMLLSIGCGPSTELVGIDYYNKINQPSKKIEYYGIDIEKTWREIHNQIKEFPLKDNNITQFRGCYDDAITVLNSEILDDKNFNIVILNYVISSFIADKKEVKIDELFSNIANLILRKSIKNCFIIINDVNHSIRGITYFEDILNKLNERNIQVFSSRKKYFKYDNTVTAFGENYNDVITIFGHPIFRNNKCTSAQLLINCGVQNDN